MEFYKPYAGSLQYIPQLKLTDEVIKRLRQKMMEEGVIQEAENPQVVIDWYQAERDANRTAVRQSSILLLRDGGDAGTPGCIFYRKDVDRQAASTREYYHIPAAEHQTALADAWKWWEDSSGQKLEQLNQYLDLLAGTPDAWHLL